jgi:hypothetical protein
MALLVIPDAVSGLGRSPGCSTTITSQRFNPSQRCSGMQGSRCKAKHPAATKILPSPIGMEDDAEPLTELLTQRVVPEVRRRWSLRDSSGFQSYTRVGGEHHDRSSGFFCFDYARAKLFMSALAPLGYTFDHGDDRRADRQPAAGSAAAVSLIFGSAARGRWKGRCTSPSPRKIANRR